MDAQTFDQLVTVIQILIVMIAGLKFERHVTKQEANRVLDMLARLAAKTKTTVDDSLIGFARLLNNLRPGESGSQTGV